MKIAFVSSGSSIHVKKIANYLVNKGHSVTLFTMKDSAKLIDDFDKRVIIKILPFNGKLGYYLNAPFLKMFLIRGGFDVVNSHYASGYGTLSRLANVHPLVLAVFGADVYDYPFKSKNNMRRVVKNLDNADEITSTSHVMAEKVRSFYKKKRNITVTPFGVDTSIFKPIQVQKNDLFEFGIVKKIERKYGINLLIQAFCRFNKEFPNTASLGIYGRGSALDEYKKLANELGVEKLVRFMGFVPNEEVPAALCHMDVACFPSILDSESFGVAAVEAMACGTPVIVSDASGFTEVVEDGVTGFVIPKNDVGKLYDAMKKMFLMNESERKKMGQAGVERVEKLYRFEENMIGYEQVLMKAVKQ